MAATAKKRPVAVSQLDLSDLRALRAATAKRRHDLEEIEACLKQAEAAMLKRLKAGAHVQAGRLAVGVEQVEACSPSYKDELVAHFEQAHGMSEALVVDEVRKRWRRTVEKVVVTERPGPRAVG